MDAQVRDLLVDAAAIELPGKIVQPVRLNERSRRSFRLSMSHPDVSPGSGSAFLRTARCQPRQPFWYNAAAAKASRSAADFSTG